MNEIWKIGKRAASVVSVITDSVIIYDKGNKYL